MKRVLVTFLALGAVWAAGAALAATTVTLNVVQIFNTIDPAKVTDYTGYMAAVNLYDGLVTVDKNGAIQPLLASSWEASPDATTYTFHLRPNATFHDGSPVTAADVVYSVKRLLAIDQGPSYLFKGVLGPDSVTASDPHTVVFHLQKVFSPFLATVPLIFVVNSKVVQANATNGDWGQAYVADHDAGSGPYTLAGWTRGSEMRLKRYDNYMLGWGKGPIDNLRFVVTNDEATVRSLAASGELTMTSEFQANETYAALAKMPRFRVVSQPTGTAFYFKMNTQVAPTDDVHVRKAIACATDYQTIRNSIYPGAPLAGPLPAVFKNDYLTTLKDPTFDMSCAKSELAQSKYAGKGAIPLTFSYVSGASFEEEIGLLMKSNLEKIGFKVTLAPEPWNRITEIASKASTTPNVTEVFFGATYASPDSMFFTQYDTKAQGTWSSMEWLGNAEVDKMITDARATTDPAQQAAIYKKLQQTIVDLQPDVFVLVQNVRHAMDKCLTGYNYVPVQSFDYNFHNYSWTCATN
ncbi:MAG TPA: ABC transporter substrate-binding protein [Trueperaceae bacterium]|nr:ABC transporter substrate-binding protein [Trueperaceae bacterium]